MSTKYNMPRSATVSFVPLWSDETTGPKQGLLERIIWPILCIRIFIVCTLLSIAGVVFATHMNVGAPSPCRLRYEGNSNDITEHKLQEFAKESGWTLTHPEPPECNRCPQNDRFPVWMAPVDICLRFGLGSTHPLCSDETDNLHQSHVKVCATQEQIDRAWDDTGCHTTDGNVTKPFLGYDGNLFCAATFCEFSPSPSDGTCWEIKTGLQNCQECFCTEYDEFYYDKKKKTGGCSYGSETHEVKCGGMTLKTTTDKNGNPGFVCWPLGQSVPE